MRVRMSFMVLLLLLCCGVSHGQEERWNNFAEDSDLKYYLDQKSVVSLPDNIYLIWVKSVAKEKDYFKKEYSLGNVSYVLTNYEVDCTVSSYRNRGSIMFDKNRREVGKSFPASSDISYEPIAPESVLELVQSEICVEESELAEERNHEELLTVILPVEPVVPSLQ